MLNIKNLFHNDHAQLINMLKIETKAKTYNKRTTKMGHPYNN